MSDDRPPIDDDDEEPLAPSAADRPAMRAVRDRAKRLAAEEREFWNACLASPVGRRCIWQFLESCHIFGERFATTPTGAINEPGTWYRAGERDTGLRFLRSLQRHNIDAVVVMLKEHDPLLQQPPKRRKDTDV